MKEKVSKGGVGFSKGRHFGVSQNWGDNFGGPNNKDYSLLGSISGSPYLGELPCRFSGGLTLMLFKVQILGFMVATQVGTISVHDRNPFEPRIRPSAVKGLLSRPWKDLESRFLLRPPTVDPGLINPLLLRALILGSLS